MSLAKAVLDGIKDKKCKRFAQQERPPVLYVLEKDAIQETVSALKSDQSLKTTIGDGTELRLPIWHCGTCKAFLMHMSMAINAIEKRGTFKAYKEACEAYVEQREVAKQAKSGLALLNAAMSKGEKSSKKSFKKYSKKASKIASQKVKEGMALTDAPDPELCVEYQADYEKAKLATEATKNKCEAAATKIFQFYTNLLSADAKYRWNKIVKEQTEADPFRDLQGMSRKGPRGLSLQQLRHILPSHHVSKQHS